VANLMAMIGFAMLNIKKPYNFPLSVSVVSSFGSESQPDTPFLNIPLRINSIPTLLDIRQAAKESQDLRVSCFPAVDGQSMQTTAEWILFADMDLTPFYHLVENDTHFGPIVRRLWGIKPMRPASLFEMAVIAITEQQISLAAAYHIRERLLARYGDLLDKRRVFPAADVFANASVEDLSACGLTYRKSEYIVGLAQQILNGSIDFENLVRLGDDEAREILLGIRGFGHWSADYVLVRGLARPDCLPVDDIAIQSAAGKILGFGRRLTALELQNAMKPFAPFRGLAAFYMLAYEKLSHFNPASLGS
jgi:DNA-3-methyladenine glycosylase II